MALNDGAVLATGLVGSLDAAPAPVCPVNVILVLSQAKWVGQVICNDFTLQTWFGLFRGKKKHKNKPMFKNIF